MLFMTATSAVADVAAHTIFRGDAVVFTITAVVTAFIGLNICFIWVLVGRRDEECIGITANICRASIGIAAGAALAAVVGIQAVIYNCI